MPQDTQGEKKSASFLYYAARSTFDEAGFDYIRPMGKNHLVMPKTVRAAQMRAERLC